MPQILLLGRFGQLGWELERTLAPMGEVTALDFPEIDLMNLKDLDEIVHLTRPDVIVNATAYTAVDQAEKDHGTAMALNANAPKRLAELAQDFESALIHYSTDYVFDGEKGSPYIEADIPNPLGMYGKSKLAGEQAIEEIGGAYLILRTSWVYSLRRDSFVTKVLDWARNQSSLQVVSDQVSNPTWCRMLAEVTAQVLAKAGEVPTGWMRERHGLYHLAGSGFASRFDWAKKILEFDPNPDEQVVQDLQPAKTNDFPTQAQRPLFSALNCDRFTDTFSIHLPNWEEVLRLAMDTTG
ncbi:dTDP-4-dehydrorhamnose reductase [Chloroflexota bacterium]